MDDTLGDDKLRLLPTKFNYDHLDKGYSVCDNYDFYDTAKIVLRSNNGLENVSEQILKALCYVYIKSSRQQSVNDICNFLYYWLGDILLKNLVNKLLFRQVILEIFAILKNYRHEQICKFIYTYMDEDIFKKIKLIFGYTEDYVNYELDLANHNRFCNEKYHSYLTTYVETYKELYDKCKVKDKTDKYCEAFNEYYNVSKHSNLYNFSCTLKKSYEAPKLSVLSGSEAHHGHLDVLSDERSQSEVLQPTNNAEKQSEELPGQGVHNLERENYETVFIATTSDDKSTSATTKSIASASSAAGLLVTTFLVYNFTPARSWINKLLGRNQMYRNPSRERELIDHSYQHDHFDSERNKYNIMYRAE